MLEVMYRMQHYMQQYILESTQMTYAGVKRRFAMRDISKC